MGTNFSRVKKLMTVLLAFIVGLSVVTLLPSVYAENEPVKVETSFEVVEGTYDVTLDVSADEGYTIKDVTFNSETKTEAPYTYAVNEAGAYDYDVAYVNNEDAENVLHYTNSMEIPTETPTEPTETTEATETPTATPTATPNENALTWTLPGEAGLQWVTVEEDPGYDDAFIVEYLLEAKATDVNGNDVAVTLKDKGGLDFTVAGVYTLVLAALNPVTNEEETQSLDVYIKGEEIVADPMAGSTLDVTWSSATYNNAGNGTQPGGTDKAFTIIPPDASNDQLQASVAINIKEHFGVGEFSFKLPGGLDIYKAEFAPDKAPIDLTDLPLPLAPATNAGGWNYAVDGNGDIIITNTVELNPTSQVTSFSLKYNVDPMKVKTTVTTSLTPTMVAGAATPNGASVTYSANSKITSMNKGHATVYTFPAGQATYFGLTDTQFDFTNKTYIDYTINTYVAGTLGGTLSVKEIPTLSGTDRVIGMTTTVYDPADPNGTYNAGTKTYTFNPDVASTPGWKTVHVLIEYDKAGHTDPLHPGEIVIPDNNAQADHQSSDGTNTPTEEHHLEVTDPGFKNVPLTGAFGLGTLMDKSPNSLPDASAAGALTGNAHADSYIGQYSIFGNIFEPQEGAKLGFIVGDDIIYYHKVDEPSSVGKLTDGQYYYSDIYVRLPNYTFTGATNKDGVLIPAASATTESVMIRYKTSLGGGWINGPTFTYAEVLNGVSWNDSYAASPMPANVVAFEVVGTGYDYRVEINVKPTLYLKQGVGSILTGSDLSKSVVLENFSYMAPTNPIGTTILKFKKYNDVEVAQDDAGYAAFAVANTTSSIDTMIAAESGATVTTVVDAVNAATTDKKLIRQSGFFVASGLQGESGVNFVEVSHANDVPNMVGHQTRKITGYERYVMSSQNIAAFLATGEHLERTSGTLYDLLPLGVEYMGNPVATGVGGTTATAACSTEDDFNGTGRTLVTCSVSNVTGSTGGNIYYPGCGFGTSALNGAGEYIQTGFSVTYDTQVQWDNNQASTTTKDLLVYQIAAGASLVGNYPGISDMTADDSSAIVRLDPDTQAVVAGSQAVQDAFEIPAGSDTYPLSNLGPTTTSLNTVYNTGLPYPLFSTLNKTGLTKDVSYSVGTLNYKDKTTIEVGSSYQYRLTYGNGDSGIVNDIVLYDVLEDAKGTHTDYWKGTFESVDTQTLSGVGIDPVVYYSTAVGVFDVDDANFAYDLTDPAQAWSTTVPTDKTKVTAIAVDCTTKTDGTPFNLNQNQQIEAVIKMTAPETADRPDAMGNTASGKIKGAAYNRAAASVYHTSGPSAGNVTLVIDINYATEVRLIDSRVGIDLTKNDTLDAHDVVKGAYFTVTGTTNTHIFGTQLNVNITVKSAEDGDQYVNATTGALTACTAGTLYEVVITDPDGVADSGDETEKLYELALYPGEYTMTETKVPDGYVMDNTVKDNKYTITVTEDEDTSTTPSTWTYDYDVTYLKVDPKNPNDQGTLTSTIDDDNSMVYNIKGRKIGGIVWVDNFQNGEPEPTDPTYPERLWDGMTVSIVDDATGAQVIDVEGNPVADATTDANGYYEFEKLPLGIYRVIVNVNSDNYDATVINTTCVDSNNVPNGNMAYDSRTRAAGQYVVIGDLNVTDADIYNANAGLIPVITIEKYVNNKMTTTTDPLWINRDQPFTFQIKVINHAEDAMDIVTNYTVGDDLNPKFIIMNAPGATINGQSVTWTNQALVKGENPYSITVNVHSGNKNEILTNVAYGDQTDNPKRVISNEVAVKFRIETNLVTWLDCEGNTVKIEWVDYKESSSAPGGGFTYSGGVNVTADQVLYPENCEFINKYKVPNTAAE